MSGIKNKDVKIDNIWDLQIEVSLSDSLTYVLEILDSIFDSIQLWTVQRLG